MSGHLSRRDLLRLGAVALGGAALGGVAGCATGGDGGASGQRPASGPTDFSFASWGMAEDATKAALGPAVESFAKKDGIAIATPSYPFNDYLNQVMLQIRGRQFTGAAQLDVAWLSSMVALGSLRDLGSFAQGRGYTPEALTAGQFKDGQWALPWTIGAIGLVTNTELFDKAGVKTAPTTVEEFEDTLRALKGVGVIPYAASTKIAQLKDFVVWAQTFGSPIVEQGRCTLGDAGSVEAATWYKKLFDDRLITADVDRAAARTLFSQGKTAMYDDAPVGRAGVLETTSDPDLKSKMAPIARPVVKQGDTPQELLWGHLVAVVDDEGSDTAAEFAQWLTSDPAQVSSYFSALGLPPVTSAMVSSPEVKKNEFLNAFTTLVTKDAKASALWQFPQYAQMETAIAEQVQAVLVGSASPADAMKQAGEKVNGLIG